VFTFWKRKKKKRKRS